MVVDKFVLQLEVQLSDKQVEISLDDAARDWLAARGYDSAYGARPLARIVQEHIKKPLADALLFGALMQGGTVQISVKDGALALDMAPHVSSGQKKKTEAVR